MISGLISLIVWLLVIGILAAIVIYIADNLLPAPFGRWIRVAAVVIGGLLLLLLLLQMLGGGGNLAIPKVTF